MKNIVVLFLLYGLKIYADNISAAVEMFFGTEQASGGSITFSLLNHGQVWGGEEDINCNFNWYTTDEFNSPSYTVTTHNQSTNNWAGLDFTTSQDNGGTYDIFGYGLYEVTNSESDTYFYIDYRDQRVGCETYGNNGHHIDVWFKYNATTNKFWYSNDASNFNEISNGQLLQIWELKNANTPQTDSFPYFWSKNLVLIPTPNNNPRLIWGPHPTFSATHYRLYRGVSNYPVNPLTLNYTCIATVSSSTFDNIDYAVTIQSGYQYAYYYVVGWDGSEESDNSNYVSTAAEFHKLKVDIIQGDEITQNYPNPFNPTTRIKYQVANDSKVSLKVFDVLGNEITTLVNEKKPAGIYEVEFHGTNLPGGVYFYRLFAGSYTETKKMILLR